MADLPQSPGDALEPDHFRPTNTARQNSLVLWILVISTMVMIFNETVLSVALPIISQDFGVEATMVQWLTTGFLLVMAIVFPMTGYLLQRFSTRTMFVAALALFAVGTAAAGMAWTFPILLVARLVQAIGTAVIIPLLMTVTMTTVPPERRGATMGLIGVVISVAPALGPTVSGVILSALSWHWLFWTVLPIVVLCLVIGIKFMRNVSEQHALPLDIISVPLSALGFGGLVYGLSEIGTVINGSTNMPLAVLAVGVVFLVLFVLRQLKLGKRDAALLNLQPFSFRPFCVAVIAIGSSMGVLLGTVVVLPFFLQDSLGASALQTGLLVLPGGLLEGLASPVVGRIYDQRGARVLVIPGAIGITVSELGLSMLSENSSIFAVLVLHMLLCLSLACVMTPLMTDGLAAVPKNLYSHGSAILNTLEQLGGAAGTAILVAAMTVASKYALDSGDAPTTAMASGASTAFIVGTLVGVATLVTVLFAAGKTTNNAEVASDG